MFANDSNTATNDPLAAEGLEFDYGGSVHVVRAAKEVVLTAG